MKERNSEINKNYKISEDRWVLTLACKMKGSNPKHSFFILEGIANGKAVTWFIDFAGNPFLYSSIPNGRIRFCLFISDSEIDLENNPLIFRCKEWMMDLNPNDEIAIINNKPWYINKEDANRLITSIKQDEKNPPIFNIFGKNSVSTRSNPNAIGKDNVYNCFTYAKEKIDNLKIASINIECDPTTYCVDQIANIRSFTLKDPKKATSYCPYFSKTVLVGVGLVAIASAIFYNTSKLNRCI